MKYALVLSKKSSLMLCGLSLFVSAASFAQEAPPAVESAPPETPGSESAVEEVQPVAPAALAAPAEAASEASEQETPGEPKEEPVGPDELVAEPIASSDESAEVDAEKADEHRYAFGRSPFVPESVATPSIPANAQLFMKNHGHVYGVSGWSTELGFTVGSMVGQFVGSVLFDGSGAPSSVGAGYQLSRPGIFLLGNRDIRLSLSLPTVRAMGYYWWAETGGIVSVQTALVGATLTGDRNFKWYVNFAPVGASGWLALTPDLDPLYSVAVDLTTEVGIWW